MNRKPLTPDDIERATTLLNNSNEFKKKVTKAYIALQEELVKIEHTILPLTDESEKAKLKAFDTFLESVQNITLGSVVFDIPIKEDRSLPVDTLYFNSNPPTILFNVSDG